MAVTSPYEAGRAGLGATPLGAGDHRPGEEGINVNRPMRLLVVVAGLIVAVGLGVPGALPSAVAATPLWVQHVQNYDGGISNGVRASLDPNVATARARYGSGPFTATGFTSTVGMLDNVQMNDDSTPPLPQDETTVAFKPFNPLVAVAAANDYVSGGVWIGTTRDGGRTWASQRIAPVSSAGQMCSGGDPSVVYSVRDHAFYLSQLCFFFTAPDSEVDVYKSTDDGATWSSGSIVVTNRSSSQVDGSVFYDKELLAVDNNSSSRFFGRVYVTFIKFHLTLPSGRSDFCPVQLAFTDLFGKRWSHTAVVPDGLGAVGPGANQWATPVVDSQGGLDIPYVSEDCNTAVDRALLFTRSTDGGANFAPTVQIDKPGQFADNPNTQDLLPSKQARIPISPSVAFNPTTGTLGYVYQNNVDRAVSGADISFQQSSDFGATWSDAKTISTTPSGAAAPQDQFFPWISVDEAGSLNVIWFDNRNDPSDTLIETFQAKSSNDGATWKSADISTAPWNPNQGFFTCGCFIGDYSAIAASTQAVYPVWTDGRNSPGRPNGDTNIFTNVEIGGFH